jgi:hypothetical protein
VAFTKNKRTPFTGKLDLNLRMKLANCYIWCKALYGAERWTIREVDQKYLVSFEVWCWRRMQKMSWTDRVRNEEVLHRLKERNILHTIKRRKANWIGHMLRGNCLLKHVIEGKTEGRRSQGRKSQQILDNKRTLEL